MVNVKLIKVEDCFKSPVMSVINTYRTDNYQLYFSESWDFFYRPYLSHSLELLCKRFGAVRYPNESKCLRNYYGIELVDTSLTPDNIVDVINSETDSGRPVLVGFEPYWSPWNNNYKKNHGGSHFCFIIGIDTSNEELLCSDPFYNTEFERWQIEEFFNGYKRAFTFSLNDDFMKEIRPEQIIRNAIDIHKKNNTFIGIRQFGDEMERYDNIFLELEQYHDNIALWGAPYISNIRGIYFGRVGFAKALKFLGEACDYPVLDEISTNMSAVSSSWTIIDNVLKKAVLAYQLNKKKNQKILKEISCKIKEAADKEEDVHNQLLKLLPIIEELKSIRLVQD